MPGLMVPWIVLSIIGLILLVIVIIGYLGYLGYLGCLGFANNNFHLRLTFLTFLPVIAGIFAFAIGFYNLVVVWSFR